MYGADAVVLGTPVCTVVVEAFLQDVLVPREVHMRVGDPPEDMVHVKPPRQSHHELERPMTYAPLTTWMERVLVL